MWEQRMRKFILGQSSSFWVFLSSVLILHCKSMIFDSFYRHTTNEKMVLAGFVQRYCNVLLTEEIVSYLKGLTRANLRIVMNHYVSRTSSLMCSTTGILLIQLCSGSRRKHKLWRTTVVFIIFNLFSCIFPRTGSFHPHSKGSFFTATRVRFWATSKAFSTSFEGFAEGASANIRWDR